MLCLVSVFYANLELNNDSLKISPHTYPIDLCFFFETILFNMSFNVYCLNSYYEFYVRSWYAVVYIHHLLRISMTQKYQSLHKYFLNEWTNPFPYK